MILNDIRYKERQLKPLSKQDYIVFNGTSYYYMEST